jgi:esterase/lipase
MTEILLLHGAIGSRDQFHDLAADLKKDFVIHSLNFSGHGGEEMPRSFSIETFSRDVISYLDKNNIEKINIFGYSMGGFVALYLAKHYPERIEKIFTLATKFLWTPEISAREIKMLNADRITEKIPSFAETLKKRHFPNDWKEVLRKTSEMMLEMSENNPLKSADYSSIEHKVLIGIGDKDSMVTLEETIEVYRELKNSNLIVLPETQHPIEKVNTERLAYEIRSFYSSTL